MIKKGLKIVEKLPRVQVGNILNVFWTNGSYERPSNPITRQEVNENFIDVIAKIDWPDADTGIIKLEGKFNYLVYKGGEFYFLNPVRVVDVKKQIFIYSVVKDITMTMLYSPTVRLVGTLTKTLDEQILIDKIDFTKPLVEDFDETLVIPISEDDKLTIQGGSYDPIDYDTLITPKVFSTQKLAWLIGNFFDWRSDDLFKNWRWHSNIWDTRLLLKCEFDNLIAHKEVLDYLNEWLGQGNLVLGSVKDKNKLLDDYSCGTLFKKIYEQWPTVYVLSKVNPSLDLEQHTYFEKFNVADGKEIPADYFADVNKVIPLSPDKLEPYSLDNRNIFDMMADVPFVKDVNVGLNEDNVYTLTPRIYTNLEKIYGLGKTQTLKYNISYEQLEKLGHLTDDKQTEKDGISIINNIEFSYMSDFWNTDWSSKSLAELPDSIKKLNPAIGFALYDIYDYWKYTRGWDTDKKFYNMYRGSDTLSNLRIVTGLKFYDKDDKDSEIDLKIQKVWRTRKNDYEYEWDSRGKINFGLVTSEACKQLNNAFEVFSMYTIPLYLQVTKDEYEVYDDEKILCNFPLRYKDKDTDDIIVTSGHTDFFEVNEKELWWQNYPNFIYGKSNSSIFEYCYKNYADVRDISTITSLYAVIPAISTGDLFWSNVSWCFHKESTGETLKIDKTTFAILVGPNNDPSIKSRNIRISKLMVHDIKPKLNSFDDNIISTNDERQIDKTSEIYPWIVTEKKYFLPSYEDDILKFKEEWYTERRDTLKRLLREFADLIGLQVTKSLFTFNTDHFAEFGIAPYREKQGYGIRDEYITDIPYGPFRTTDRGGYMYEGRWCGRWKYYIPDHPSWTVWHNSKNLGWGGWVERMHTYIDRNYRGDIIRIENNLLEVVQRFARGSTFLDQAFIFRSDDHGIVGKIYFYRFNICKNFYAFIEIFSKKIDRIIKKWNECEWKYQNRIYNFKEFNTSEIANKLAFNFSPTSKSESNFDSIFSKFGYKTRFRNQDGREIHGNLSLTLYRMYKENGNTDLCYMRADGHEAYWTDVTLDYLRQNHKKESLYVFKLVRSNNNEEFVKGYVLMQKDEKNSDKFIIQVLLGDKAKIINKHKKLTTPNEELITNNNIFQCINQKNFFYAYGQKIPIKGKLMKPYQNNPFEIFVSTLSASSDAITKFKVNIKTPVEIIDTKISVPKRKVELQRGTLSYVDLEKLRIDVSEREENKSLNLISGKERARLLEQKLQNAKEELAFQEYIGPWNILGGALSGAARTSRFFDPAKGLAYPNLAAGLLGASTITNLITGSMQHHENMRVGKRDIEQMDQSNAFTVAHEKNVLDSKHKHEELREKIKIMELTSNYTDVNSGEDDEEVKTSNKLLFDDEKVQYGFIHYRPKNDGKLMEYIKHFYARYGVDVFINGFQLSMASIIDKDISIWRFDSITEINVLNHSYSEKVRAIFINGVKFIRTKYAFDHPKFSLDQSFVVKARAERHRKIDDAKLLLQARGELDNELRDAVRIAKEDLDAANQLHEELKEQKTEVESRLQTATEQLAECNRNLALEKAEKDTLFNNARDCSKNYLAEKTKNTELTAQVAELTKAKDEATAHLQECSKNIKKLADSNKDLLKTVNEDVIFNKYIDDIENMISSAMQNFEIIIQIIKDNRQSYIGDTYGNKYTWKLLANGFQFSIDDGKFKIYLNSGETWSDGYTGLPLTSVFKFYNRDEKSKYLNTLSVALGSPRSYYYPALYLIDNIKTIVEGAYKGFEINFPPYKQHKIRFCSKDYDPQIMREIGIFIGKHNSYIAKCTEFSNWNDKTNYLERKKIKLEDTNNKSSSWNTGDVRRFNKYMFFNRTYITFGIYE